MSRTKTAQKTAGEDRREDLATTRGLCHFRPIIRVAALLLKVIPSPEPKNILGGFHGSSLLRARDFHFLLLNSLPGIR